jgi:integrase
MFSFGAVIKVLSQFNHQNPDTQCCGFIGRQARLKVSCHQLRHTMATQLLNADAALVTIQDLLGHTRIKTTQRYCRVSNLKGQQDYHRAMAAILQITG